MRYSIPTLILSLLMTSALHAQFAPEPAPAPAPAAAPAATQPGGKLPHIQVDVQKKQIRVECEAINKPMLEFFCVTSQIGPEHETVLRSAAKASHLQLALLMLGLQAGEPVHYSESMKKWLPPQGPPLQIFCEFEKDGKTVRYPAYRLMRNVKTKKEAPVLTWVFTGSRVMPDGVFAADVTGYLISVVNFDLTLIDIPDLASNSNDTLEWETNTDLAPKTGAPVTMIIEPAGKQAAGEEPATRPAVQSPVEPPAPAIGPEEGTGAAKPGLTDVQADDAKVKALRQRWEAMVAPQKAALNKAAQTHYDVIQSLRTEQQRLIDEADRIQRVIDELEKEYQEMTTPHPVLQTTVPSNEP